MPRSQGWTAVEMPDIDGQTVIVTGANSGLGYEATRAFARVGARVILACRSVDRGEAAAAEIEREVAGADLSVRELDLASLSSVRAFADGFDGDLHALCNNAGVMALPRSETTEGFETQFGVNHLGHFALTGLLFDRLRETAATAGDVRVVTHASGLHERGEIDFDDLQGERDYDRWEAYAQSKLANVLFAYELDRRLGDSGIDDVTSVACHPGYAATNLQRRGPEAEGSRLKAALMTVANAVFAQSAARGALPLLYAATAPDVDGGDYVGPGGLLNMRGTPEKQRSSERSYDRRTAARLWDVSENLTGVTYGFTEKATGETP
ncbi:oxidoreductase [Salinigranum marinum]|uniref:oxidoreductase n=1 Tax=Salinigranum marinum TaxID=1515595 RepID=UPI002989FD7C|nr:oxidoreductase [Salinigranum marinum]